jgi:hypothetical protein
LLGISVTLLLGCSNDTHTKGGETPEPPAGPFRSLEVAANAPSSFTQPRAGVPFADGSVAFIATLEGLRDAEDADAGERVGVLWQPAGGGAAKLLYSGDQLVNPLDIDVSLDEKTLYVADPAAGADGEGALVALPVEGGEPSLALTGQRPRSVTVGSDGALYFSGISDETAEAGVFRLNGATSSPLFVGAPLVDPSGIAVKANGDVLVADTRLFDGSGNDEGEPLNSEAGIVLIHDGTASLFATGFSTGYPAGVALTSDDKALIVSGEGPDRSDTVYIFDTEKPKLPPTVVTDSFSAFQDSSAGLKRSHQGNTFIWASLAVDGGTLYRIEGR